MLFTNKIKDFFFHVIYTLNKPTFKLHTLTQFSITKNYSNYIDEINLIDAYFEKFQYSKSRGIDGKTGLDLKIEPYKSKKSDIQWISEQLQSNSYKFQSYQEVIISKGKGKEPRVISKATIRDTIVLYTLKEYFKDNIRGSITTKANDLIQNVITKLKKIENIEDYVFFQTDIKNYYGSINQEILTSKIEKFINEEPEKNKVISLIKNIIQNPTIEFGTKKPNENYKVKVGTPQGLSISNILANLYMLEFDFNMNKLVESNQYGLSGYYRYVDDILIICKKSEFQKVKYLFKNEILKYKLKLHNEKTKTIDLSKNKSSFDFLGYVFSYKKNYSSKHLKLNDFLIVPRKKTSNNFNKSILSLFTKFRKNMDEINKLSNKKTRISKIKLLKTNFLFRINISIGGCIANNNRYGFFTYFSKISSPFLSFQIKNIIKKEVNKLLERNYIVTEELEYFKNSIKDPVTCFYSTQNEKFFKKNIAINFDDYMNYQEYVNQINKEQEESEEDYYKKLNKISPEDFVKKYDTEHYDHLRSQYKNKTFRNKIYYYFNKLKQKNLDILSKDIKGSLSY